MFGKSNFRSQIADFRLKNPCLRQAGEISNLKSEMRVLYVSNWKDADRTAKGS